MLSAIVYKFPCVQMFSVLFEIYLAVDLLSHMITQYLAFLGKNNFPKQLHHFTFQPAQHKGSGCSTSSLTLAFFHSYHSEYSVVCHCNLNLQFPSYEWCWASFYVLLTICIFSLKQYLLKFFATFYLSFLIFWSLCSLHILNTFPCQIYILQIFSLTLYFIFLSY